MVNNNNNAKTYRYIAEDYYEVKKIDRQLSSPHIKPNVLFCDVGSNRGTDNFPFITAGAKGVCLDIEPKRLHEGKQKAKEAKVIHSLDYIRGSATHLPFRSETFNLITSYSVIDHLPSKTDAYNAIHEFSRITKRGGHVVVTVPNQLFILGSLMMVIKMITQPESFFEQRFTPKELIRQCSNSKLQTVKYDSKYPLIIGESILKYNVPQMLQKMPDTVQLELCRLAEKIFKIAEKDLCLRLLGARFGLDSVKT